MADLQNANYTVEDRIAIITLDHPPVNAINSQTMKDLDVPQYDHGGGVVEFSGQSIIEPGAFKYRSPCPPGGSHTYQWEATAKSKKSMFGGTLGKAKASGRYPN